MLGIVKWGFYIIGLRLKGGEIFDVGFFGDLGIYEFEDVINVGVMDYFFGVVEDNLFLELGFEWGYRMYVFGGW